MGPRRLLVIDDEREISEIVRAVAEGVGYEVRIADDADQFVKLHNEFAPTVVVLDVVMPEVDGVELAQWMAHEKSPARVIFLTGYNPRFTDAARALADAGELASVTTLIKPISVEALRQALE